MNLFSGLLQIKKSALSKKISAISSVDKTQKNFDIVEDFMNRIDANKEFNNDFKDIKFESMEKSNAKGNEVLSFTIEARLK